MNKQCDSFCFLYLYLLSSFLAFIFSFRFFIRYLFYFVCVRVRVFTYVVMLPKTFFTNLRVCICLLDELYLVAVFVLSLQHEIAERVAEHFICVCFDCCCCCCWYYCCYD